MFFRGYMQYRKPWLSYDQQADKLAELGLIFNRTDLITRLKDVGYYRLSGYWYIFKQISIDGSESFIPGTRFNKIWQLYTFDRQLRLVVLDAIERLEIYMRTQLAYRLAQKDGPFGYLNAASLPNMNEKIHCGFISRCFKAYDRSKTLFTDHFKEKYGDSHELPPYWMLVNIMDFGMMLTLFRGSSNEVKGGIANEIGVPYLVLESWLITLNTVRNICAHHDRLWNRRLGNKTKIPRGRKYPEWHHPYEVNNSSTFTLLTILGYILERIAPDSSWHTKMLQLINTRTPEDLQLMGFNEGWKTCPIWGRWLEL